MLLPFEANDSAPILELRRFASDRAKTDVELVKISAAVIEHGRQEGVIALIQEYLQGKCAGTVGRRLWLAGLLDKTSVADQLWSTTLAEPLYIGWQRSVHETARGLYLRNAWARHWLDEYLSERDRDIAFGRYLLFMRSADHRALRWAPRDVGKVWDELPKAWQVHWSACWQELVRAIETRDKEWEKSLFGTQISSHIQWPWR